MLIPFSHIAHTGPMLAQIAFRAPDSLLDPRIPVALLGVLLLGWGARLYKMAIAAPGFVLGVGLVLHFTTGMTPTIALAAVVAGLAGAALLLKLERLAVSLTGAVLVGGLVYAVGPLVVTTPLPWFAPLIGAAVGMLLFPGVYRFALRVITPLLGAFCVAWAVGRPQDLLLIGGLAAVGSAFQLLRGGKGGRKREDKEDRDDED